MTQKAPGKSHRKDTTMAQLFKMFLDKTATAWIEHIRWPEGATCPHCDGSLPRGRVIGKRLMGRNPAA